MRGQVKVLTTFPGLLLSPAEEEGLPSFPRPCGFVQRRFMHKHFRDETASDCCGNKHFFFFFPKRSVSTGQPELF